MNAFKSFMRKSCWLILFISCLCFSMMHNVSANAAPLNSSHSMLKKLTQRPAKPHIAATTKSHPHSLQKTELSSSSPKMMALDSRGFFKDLITDVGKEALKQGAKDLTSMGMKEVEKKIHEKDGNDKKQ